MSTEQKEELQLVIKTIDFTPAIVKFNSEQISILLDAQLAKYQGLTFTEDSEKQAKAVIAELNKGKKLLDTYRKDTKAKLTTSVTDFEEEIKKLSAKFDAVITPLTEQTAKFEVDRKHKKKLEIEALIAELLTEHELSEQFAAKLIYPDEYLNRTLSIKSITFDLQALAESLRADQDRLANELQLICGSVQLANQALAGAGFLETTYTRLLGPLTMQQVLSRINEDVAAVNEREAQKAIREAAAEVRRLEVEAVAESNRLAAESSKAFVQAEPPKVYEPIKPAAPVIKVPEPAPAFSYSPPVSSPAAERFIEKYQVTGTEAQLDSLVAFLEQHGFEWKIIED